MHREGHVDIWFYGQFVKQRAPGNIALLRTGGRSDLNGFRWYRPPETCSTKMTVLSVNLQVFPKA